MFYAVQGKMVLYNFNKIATTLFILLFLWLKLLNKSNKQECLGS